MLLWVGVLFSDGGNPHLRADPAESAESTGAGLTLLRLHPDVCPSTSFLSVIS